MKLLFSLITLAMTTSAIAADFSNESEAGIAVATGNSKSKNYNLKQDNTLKVDANVFKFSGRYLNAYADDKESARYLFGGLRYERELTTDFSVYVGQGLESDKFSGYDRRHLNDIGAKYKLITTETIAWFVEAGYRYTDEKLTNGSKDYRNSLRAFTQVEKKWNPSVSTKYWVEYVPNLDNSKDYEINTEVSVSAALSSIFSIKSAYLLKYDRVPAAGASTRTDTLLTTALVAKF